jgi:amino acid adenylation domain-containing protein
MHHIVSDGWSEGVLGRELSALYTAFSAGLPSPLPELPVQPADHAVWQRAQLTGRRLDELITYAKERLGGAPPALDLPTDRPRPASQTYAGATHPFTLPRELSAALGALSRREGVTLFMTLLAAFQVLLHRYTGQDDIVVGSPIAGRTRPEIEGLIGFFVSTLVLRAQLGDQPTLRELLGRVREAALDAYAHQDLPFEKLVDAVVQRRDLSRSPVFQASLVLQNAPPAPPSLGPVPARRVEVERGSAKFDLTLVFQEDEASESLAGFLEYPTALFDAATIARMAGHLVMLLRGAVADPGRRVSELPLLPPDERHRLLVEWNDTAKPYPEDVCLHQMFEALADRTPDATAVVFGRERIAYGELDRRANRLANHLRTLGVGPEVLVGLCVRRSPEMLVAMLGILKAGGAYVPLDPGYPRERLAFTLEDSGAPVVVTEQHAAFALPDHGARMVVLDAEQARIDAASDARPASGVGPENLAYVLFTSGSTGRPKGAMIEHRGVVNYLSWAVRAYDVAGGRGAPVHSSVAFDLTVTGLFAPLLAGRTVELLPEEPEIESLVEALSSGGFSLVKLTPAHLEVLNRLVPPERAAGATGVFVIGGEQLSWEALAFWRRHAPGTRLVNEYGPTETVVGCCVYEAPPATSAGGEKGAVPIGRPIANTKLYVLDAQREPVPIGVPGELYIGGAGVARGYVNRPELTLARFVDDPFHDGGRPGARMYKTGDLVRYLPDGNLEFIGRLDNQVKVRGFRIELGEIEAALREHPGVGEVVVLAREDAPGDKRLVAYVATGQGHDGGDRPSSDDLRAVARRRLPEYMVPSAFVALDAMPLTANGKVDRQALPAPARAVAASSGGAGPRGALELELAAIWEELLGLEHVGVRDSFFDLGGHSLLAVKLFHRIAQATGIDLPIASLFRAPTIAALADLLRGEGWARSWSSLVPIQTSGSRAPLYCVHAVGGNVLNYRLLSQHLGKDQPFYGLQARGLGGGEAPHTTVEEMAAAYIQEMRQEQPRGPYILAGASSGGVIAYEMAQQLRAAGEQVPVLLLIDTYIAQPLPRIVQAQAASPLHRSALLLDYHLGQLLLRTPREGYAYLAARIRARLGGVVGPTAEAIHAAPPALRHVIEANLRAVAAYVPRPYPGSAVMLFSREEPERASYDGRLGWADLLEGGLVVRFIPGSHENMLDEPQVAEVARVLARCLAPLSRS